MCPLRLLFSTRTAPPAKLLLEQPKGLFDLLPVGVIGFGFTWCERQIVRSPVTAAVFDHQHWMFYTPQFSPRVPIAMRPGRPKGVVTKLAVTLEAHHIRPSPAIQKIHDLCGGIPAITQDIRGLQSPPPRLPEQPDG